MNIMSAIANIYMLAATYLRKSIPEMVDHIHEEYPDLPREMIKQMLIESIKQYDEDSPIMEEIDKIIAEIGNKMPNPFEEALKDVEFPDTDTDADDSGE